MGTLEAFGEEERWGAFEAFGFREVGEKVPMRVPFVTTLFLLLLVVMPRAKRVASAMHPLKHLPFEMRGREAVAGALDEASSPS